MLVLLSDFFVLLFRHLQFSAEPVTTCQARGGIISFTKGFFILLY